MARAEPTVPRPAGEPWPEDAPPANEARVLIFAPTGSDGRLTAEFVAAAGIPPRVVCGMAELVREMRHGCGAVVLAEEVITGATAPRLFGALKQQPDWSDVPLILVASGGADGEDRMRRLVAFDSNRNVTVLERPFRPATLVSAVEVGLRSRRRQYQVRKLLTELGEARDAAERASHAKDEFLAALSHELRTPLNPVLLLATEAAADPSLPAAAREDFDAIARNVMLEARLIDDLLDLTRIAQGKIHLDVRPVDVHAVLRAALETIQPEVGDKRLTVQLDWRARRTRLLADAARLQQVLWNLLKNAAKFTDPGGTLRLETENRGEQIVIRVADTGIGMNPAELVRIFDAFVQGDHARTPGRHRFGGLGLGLAISRRLVELHGGGIEASSPGAGRGSTFTVTLPVDAGSVPACGPPAAAGVPADGGGGSKRVLVVEDHVATRLSLVRMLERRGYQVQAAGSLAEARAQLAGGPVDLVLSDLGLPDGSGHELMLEFRGRSNFAGIALSGYGMEEDLTGSRSAGFLAHLTKPVTVQALDAALDAATRRRADQADR